jgi:uncharacterized membrane protein
MTFETTNLIAIAAMAAATYATRLAGLWLVRALKPTAAIATAMDAMPVAVLTAVIAPGLVKGGPADMAAAALTIAAAMRLPLLVTVAIGMAAVVILRSLLG